MRKKVYIAGPITRGKLADNVNRATEAFVSLAKAGLAPFCPHWSVYSKPCVRWTADALCAAVGTVNGNDDLSHADWLGLDLPWVAAADAVLRLPGESTGADLETACAADHGIPVFHSLADVIAWASAPAAVGV